jgi:hypothetical protein
MMWKFLLRFPYPPLLLLCATTATFASSTVVDMKGKLISVEAATAITTEGTTVSVIKVRQNDKAGRSSEEIVPETADAQADLAPQILLDPGSGDLILLWSRFDGRRMALAGSRRDASGAWTPLTYLDTGKEEPTDPQIALDASARLHVLWKISRAKTGPELRHRAFDLGSFQSVGDVVDPFAQGATPARRAQAAKPDKALDKAIAQPGRDPNASPGLTVEDGRKREPFSTYGIESGCDAAVVYRISGKHLEVASILDGKWQRGDVNVDGATDAATVRSLVADIASRFCKP